MIQTQSACIGIIGVCCLNYNVHCDLVLLHSSCVYYLPPSLPYSLMIY